MQNRFPVGSRVEGKVVNLAAYGAFVEIAPGIEG
ncbi:MAG: S1 RNA-binding domain-containing protein, partial [Treponema sp.]|nr:S1 RNA-binding domain-containing protein [Treponema sp.]